MGSLYYSRPSGMPVCVDVLMFGPNKCTLDGSGIALLIGLLYRSVYMFVSSKMTLVSRKGMHTLDY